MSTRRRTFTYFKYEIETYKDSTKPGGPLQDFTPKKHFKRVTETHKVWGPKPSKRSASAGAEGSADSKAGVPQRSASVAVPGTSSGPITTSGVVPLSAIEAMVAAGASTLAGTTSTDSLRLTESPVVLMRVSPDKRASAPLIGMIRQAEDHVEILEPGLIDIQKGEAGQELSIDRKPDLGALAGVYSFSLSPKDDDREKKCEFAKADSDSSGSAGAGAGDSGLGGQSIVASSDTGSGVVVASSRRRVSVLTTDSKASSSPKKTIIGKLSSSFKATSEENSLSDYKRRKSAETTEGALGESGINILKQSGDSEGSKSSSLSISARRHFSLPEIMIPPPKKDLGEIKHKKSWKDMLGFN